MGVLVLQSPKHENQTQLFKGCKAINHHFRQPITSTEFFAFQCFPIVNQGRHTGFHVRADTQVFPYKTDNIDICQFHTLKMDNN